MPAINVVQRIEQMCDFIGNPVVQKAVEEAVPVTMARKPGALGFDEPLWVGLGLVGIWAALDGYADRAKLPKKACSTCGRHCIHAEVSRVRARSRRLDAC